MQLPNSLSRIKAVARGTGPPAWLTSLPFWVSAALVLLLAWQAIQLVWAILGARPTPATVSGGPGEAPTAFQGPTLDVNGIVNAHLFGVAGASGSGETDPSQVAATQMNLVLVGTIAA